MAWGHAIAAALGGYMKGRAMVNDEEDRKDERDWRAEQRERQRKDNARADRLQADLETAGQPVLVEEGVVKPAYADNRDMDGTVAPVAGGYRVAGSDFASRAEADAAATKANSPDAVAARVGTALRRNGQVERAMAMDGNVLQRQAAQLQLDEAMERRVNEAFDKQLLTIDSPQTLAATLSGSPVVGGRQVSAVMGADGKSFQLMTPGPDGAQVPVGQPMPADAKELRGFVTQFAQGMNTTQRLQFMYQQAQAERQAAQDKQAQANADRSFGMQERQFAHSVSADNRRIAIAQQQANASAAAGATGAGKPPPGYRFTPGGNLEAIPGGPADIKAGELGAKKVAQRNAAMEQAGRVINKIDQSLSTVGANTAGAGGRILSKIPGTDARDLASDLETIKANLGFAELQAMRDASPTGGALGAIAVQELIALQSTIASLDQSQSPDQLRRNLNEVRRRYSNWRSTVQQAAEGEAEQPAPGATQAAAPPRASPGAAALDIEAEMRRRGIAQ